MTLLLAVQTLSSLGPVVLAFMLLALARRNAETASAMLAPTGLFIGTTGLLDLLSIWHAWHPPQPFASLLALSPAAAVLVCAALVMRLMPWALVARDSTQFVEIAEQTAQIGHWRWNVRSNALFWSANVYRAYGLATTGRPDIESALAAFDPADVDRIRESLARARTDGIPFMLETRLRRPDGSMRNVSYSGEAQRAADGAIVALLGVLNDITLRKDVERERDRLLERVALATRASKVAQWEWDIATGCIVWDRNMYALYGQACAGGSVDAHAWSAAVLAADRARALREFDAALAGSAAFDSEYRVVWPDGEIHHLRALATVGRDTGGAALRVVGMNWDVSELRNLEQEVRDEKNRLLQTLDTLSAVHVLTQDAHRAHSDFLMRLQHELRTPLNGMLGMATQLLDADMGGEACRQLHHINAAGQTLLAMIDGIFDVAQSGDVRLVLEPETPLCDAADDVAGGAAPIAETPLGLNLLLELFDDDGGAVANLLNAALESIRIDIMRIETAHGRRDATATIEAAHRIKGTSGSIHAARVLDASSAIEAAVRQEPPDFSAARIVALKDAVGLLGANVHIQTKLLRNHTATYASVGL